MARQSTADDPGTSRSDRPPGGAPDRGLVATLVVTALAANGLLLVNDGVFWDAWVYHTNLTEGRTDLLLVAHLDAGLPMRGLFHVALGSLGIDPSVAHRVVALVAIVAGALLAYRLAVLTGLVSRREALFVACLGAVHPSLQTMVTDVVVPLVLSQTAVLAAVWVAWIAESRHGVVHLLLRALTVVVLVLAFEHKAMLAFFVGLTPLALLALRMPLRSAAAVLLRRRAELLALPFLFFAAASAVLPQRGFYAGEYGVGDVLRMPRVAGRFAMVTLEQGRAALESVARWPVAFASLLVAAALAPTGRDGPRDHPRDGDRRAGALFVAALLWLAAAILPFVVVTRAPALEGWEARHTLPVAWPLGLVLVAATRPIRDRLPAFARHAPRIAASVLIVGLLLALTSAHLAWLGRWAKDRATIEALRERADLRAFSVFFVFDEGRIGRSPYYAFYEWAGIFKSAWGEERWYGVDGLHPDAVERDAKYFGPFYLLSDADPGGCQAMLFLDRARDESDELRLGLDYALDRLRGDGGRVVRGLVSIRSRALPMPPGRSCPPLDDGG